MAQWISTSILPHFASDARTVLSAKLRRVAIPAEMSEHDALDFSRQQFLDHACRSCIRQMAMPRLDSLFYRPGPMRVVLQNFSS